MSALMRFALSTLAAVSLLGLRAPAVLVAQDVVPSGMFDHESLDVRESGTVRIREMLRGLTHSGFQIDLHSTELAAGQAPHAPHRHVHEEMLLIQTGTLDVTVAGRTQHLGPGSAIYIASGEEHGWRNAGDSPARYFVLALGTDDEREEPSGPSASTVSDRPEAARTR